jgi:hypothetical protein
MSDEGISSDKRTSQKGSRANGNSHPQHDRAGTNESKGVQEMQALVKSSPYPSEGSQGNPDEGGRDHDGCDINDEHGTMNIGGQGVLEGILRDQVKGPLDRPERRSAVRVVDDVRHPGAHRAVQCHSRQYNSCGSDGQASRDSTESRLPRHPRVFYVSPKAWPVANSTHRHVAGPVHGGQPEGYSRSEERHEGRVLLIDEGMPEEEVGFRRGRAAKALPLGWPLSVTGNKPKQRRLARQGN